jgi:hypothetical protein
MDKRSAPFTALSYYRLQRKGVKGAESLASLRWFKCYCGYEDDRDVIAIANLNGRGSLTLSTAPQM